ncbi:hypothetical protein CAPTEDRAFT_211676 [Capitella teleta]|uniref:G-protein coupled receptors family 1 profile domain-containing protein n=1 Tax=Capitella teleta TaxID=283909 RepID=R7UN58_CAPTE|nr:hypothetical protein CAPTEDRAFT_211676 [Capitella teleta]|eukprot:ELU07635.1 hypothetical protein CAPTEDRAFT_211676 [Capitella teleta]
MALSVDRFFALKFPMKHSKYWSARKAKVLAIIIGLVSLCIGSTFPLRYYISPSPTLDVGSAMPAMSHHLGLNEAFTMMCASCEILFLFAIPFSVMASTNTTTMVIMRKSDKFSRGLDKETHSTLKTPKHLSTTIGIVIITQILKVVFLVNMAIRHADNFNFLFNFLFRVSYFVCDILTQVNSTVNIFVYLTLNKVTTYSVDNLALYAPSRDFVKSIMTLFGKSSPK